MKKKYSDPLMFSVAAFTGGIVVETSPEGDYFKTVESSLSSVGSVSISSSTEAGKETEVQIVEPPQETEEAITEEGIKSVLDQLLGEENETVPSDESSIAD